MVTQATNRTPNPAYTVCEGTTGIDRAITDKAHDLLVRPSKGVMRNSAEGQVPANAFVLGAHSSSMKPDGKLYTPAMTPLAEFVNWTIERKLQHAVSTFTGETLDDFMEHCSTAMPIQIGAPRTEAELAQATTISEQAAHIAKLEAKLATKDSTPTKANPPIED